MPVVSDRDKRALKGFSLDGRGRKHVPSPAEKRRRLIILLIVVMLFIVAALVTVGIVIPLLEEPAVMAEDTRLTIKAGKRGSLDLSWDAAKRTSGYRLILFTEEEGAEKQLYERFCRSAKCTLRAADLSTLPDNRQVGVRIIARDFLYFLEKGEEQTEPAQVEFACTLDEPVIKDARGLVSIENQSVNIKWTGWESDTYTLYLKDSSGNREMIREIRGNNNVAEMEQKQYDETISYGPRGAFKIPKDDKEYTLEMEVAREQTGVTFQGADVEFMTLSRMALMSRDVEVVCDRLEDNRYRISWNDIGSFAYAVEILRPGAQDFEQIERIDGTADLVCETKEHLRPGREYTFRVRALSEDDVFASSSDAAFDVMPDATKQGDTDSVSRPGVGMLRVVTDESTLYANIWPTKALDVWKDPSRTEKVGTAALGKCLCVLEEDQENNLFRVRVDGTEGYIDSNYCMINLPDYVGDLCQYDIPNSYASIYMVNGYYIPNVTGRVTPGYEDVLLDDNTFLVPLLYPVAIRLADAAESTLEAGYRIEINDSFRPHCATRSIYDETNKVLYWKLPDIKYDGFKTSFRSYIQNGRTVSDPPQSALPAGAVEKSLADTVGVQDQQTPQPQAEDAVLQQTAAPAETPASDNVRYTYYWEMTNGTYRLGSFLAAAASRHNLGVAMDMTLVSVQDDYRHLDMQTDMHNLSWYSAMSNNNINADILKKYLTNAGFAMIGSEWWHFQDNEATSALNPPIVENGINVEGWKKDDNGWRYRDRKGNYLVNQTVELDGASWTFDPEGYVVGQ